MIYAYNLPKSIHSGTILITLPYPRTLNDTISTLNDTCFRLVAQNYLRAEDHPLKHGLSGIVLLLCRLQESLVLIWR